DGLTMTVRTPLPIGPLVRSYVHAGLRTPAEMGPRFDAIDRAKADFLNPQFLQCASTAEFASRLLRFYQAVVRHPLHGEALGRRQGIVRHALNHLLHSQAPVEQKLHNCL